jgi:hypothetical protein
MSCSFVPLLSLLFASPTAAVALEALPMPRQTEPVSEALPAPQRLQAPGEMLPAPRRVADLWQPLPGYWHRSEMAKWQLLSVDYQGRFRPRVILAPQPYYLHDGMPYPWLGTRPMDVSPIGGR